MQFAFHDSFYYQLFYANVSQGKQQQQQQNKHERRCSEKYFSKLLRRTFIKIPVNEFSFGKITG